MGERLNYQEELKPGLASLWSGTRGRDTQGRFNVLTIRSSVQFDALTSCRYEFNSVLKYLLFHLMGWELGGPE